MSVPFIHPDYQSAHQPQGEQFYSGSYPPPPPIQRSQSLGNAPSPSTQQASGLFNMHQPLPVSVYTPLAGQQQLSSPALPQTQPLPSALPPHQPSRQPSSKPRFRTGPSPAAVAYQLSQQMQQYQGGAPPATETYGAPTYHLPPPYYSPYGQPYPPFPQDQPASAFVAVPYSPNHPSSYSPSLHTGNLPTHAGQSWYPPPHQQVAPYYYVPQINYVYQPLPIPQGPAGQPQPYPAAPDQFRRHSLPIRSSHGALGPENDMLEPGGYYPQSMRTVGGANSAPNFVTASASQTSSPPVPRGPPRKPKQSGNALWVGNLPPATDVASLKDYFSTGARDEIESVFLISKSNCAFVNYRTETACEEAMARFHNSKFRGTRLVCRPRPRKGSTTTVPEAADSATSADSATPADASEQASGDEDTNADTQEPGHAEANKAPPTGPAGAKAPRGNARFRYFILKSLTREDLEMSVKNGTWATQSHNEQVLNQAFDAAESVFLVFSANKSGEYYGYARMASRIPSDSPDAITWAPAAGQADAVIAAELPKTIYTPATATAPKGRIIDDSARGTIFWEALSDDEVEKDVDVGRDDEDSGDLKAVAKAWGKPFKVEWLSTSKVPFYRTRGLRNSLNSGREVKVARDGTELEESAGRRLVQLFHQRHTPVAGHNHPAMR